MSDFEVLQTYASWAGTAVPDKLPGIPFANLVVFEDESSLRNRLFYLVPDTSSEELRCFFYFEDNLFAKEPNGDLSLLESSPSFFAVTLRLHEKGNSHLSWVVVPFCLLRCWS